PSTAQCSNLRPAAPMRPRPSTPSAPCSSGISQAISQPTGPPDARARCWRTGCRRRIMEVRRGIAVAPGVAIGPALVLGSEDFRIPQRFVRVDAIDIELARFRGAIEAAVAEIAGHEELAA